MNYHGDDVLLVHPSGPALRAPQDEVSLFSNANPYPEVRAATLRASNDGPHAKTPEEL